MPEETTNNENSNPTNALAAIAQQQAVAKYDDDIFKELATSDFLPRLQLFTGQSDAVKEEQIPTNHYGLVQGDQIVDLGKDVDVFIGGWRPKALDMNDPVISSFDHKSDAFKEIQEKSLQTGSRCMWGFEFMVWIPSQKVMSSLYLASKSSRRLAPKVKSLIGKFATFSSQKLSNEKFTWFTNTCIECQTPGELPPEDVFIAELEKFNNPPAAQVEKEAPSEDEGRDR